MPRQRKWPPPVYHHKKSGKERMRVWVDGKSKDIVLGPIGSPEAKAEYRRQMAVMQANGGEYPDAKPQADGITVEQVIAAYVAHVEREKGEGWARLAKYHTAFKPLLAIHGHQPAIEVDAEAVELLQKAMASGSWMDEDEKKLRRRGPIGIARTLINARITIIRAAWQWAEAKKLLPKGSYSHLLSVKSLRGRVPWARETPPRDATPREHLDKVLPFCPAPVAAMLELQWWSGMRSGEVREMRRGEVDCEGAVWIYTPHVDKNAWRGEPTPPIALGPNSQKILRPWIEAAPSEDAYLFRPLIARLGKRQDALFAPPDTCYSERAYPQAVARACRRAKVKILPYGGRHAAKRRITRELGADAARAVLRQKSIEATTHYGGLDADHAREVMARFG